jgi:hypothetical protein
MATGTKLRFSEFVDLVLARLYELEQAHGPGRFFDLNAIASELREPVPRMWAFDAGKVLESRGLAQCIFALGGNCLAMLSGEGRLYVEGDQGTGIIKQYHEAPQNFVHIEIAGTNNQVSVAGDRSTVTQVSTVEQQRKPAFDLLVEIEGGIVQDSSLAPQEKQDFLTDVQMVRSQLKKREPNRAALAALLEPLSQIASIAGLVANLIKLLNP